jgi:uncharacterized membrane protein YgdD (TMEM256/DUF423 family)
MSNRIIRPIIGILGATGVGLGAFGAHALKTQLVATGHLETWHTAVLYHLIHTATILALSLYLESPPAAAKMRFLSTAVWSWICGIMLFSGSLYGLSLGGPNWLGPITPLGGLAFIVGWSCLFANGISATKVPKN